MCVRLCVLCVCTCEHVYVCMSVCVHVSMNNVCMSMCVLCAMCVYM